ncbi:MAG: hypothetical protein AAF363_16045 [Bacteroidota bacterium]
MQNKSIKFENHWQGVSDSLKKDIRELWTGHGIRFEPEVFEERAKQVLVVARNNNGELLGISTAKERFIPRFKSKLYGIRCFIDKEHRIPGLLSKLFTESIDFFEGQFDSKDPNSPGGVIAIVENERLKEYRREAEWPASKMIFVGKTKQGHHIRLRYFKGARLQDG